MQGQKVARGLAYAITAIVVVFAVRAAAAGTSLGSASLGSAAQMVSSCQQQPIGVTFDTQGGQDVSNVILNNIDTAACGGGTLQVSVTDKNARVLADLTTTVGQSNTITVPIAATDAASIFGVHVALTK